MRAACVVLFTLVLAACGSSSSSSLEDAADATSAETSRVEFAQRVSFPDGVKEYAFTSTGLYDYRGGRAVMTTSDHVPFFGEGVELREIRLIGDTAYWRWIVNGKPYWVKQSPVRKSGDPVELLFPGPGTPTKPTDVLKLVLDASSGNEVLGKEDVRGEETTHYRARVNVEELMKRVPAGERPPAGTVERFGGPVIPVDIWIDGDSRLRKIVMSRSEPAMTVTAELYDYGVEVDVQPPEGELISEAKFSELTGDFGLVAEESGEGGS